MTVQTKLADSPVSPTQGSAPSSGMHTPHRSHLGASPALSYNSLANLDDLDLESESCLPHSRPIGESSKFRSMTHVTHISHADITEMGALWKADEEISLLSLVAVGIALTPGQNKFRVQGKVCSNCNLVLVISELLIHRCVFLFRFYYPCHAFLKLCNDPCPRSRSVIFIGERSEPLSRVFNEQPRDIYIYIWPMSDRMYVSNTHEHVRMSV